MVAAPLQKGFTPSLNRPAGQLQLTGRPFVHGEIRARRIFLFSIMTGKRQAQG